MGAFRFDVAMRGQCAPFQVAILSIILFFSASGTAAGGKEDSADVYYVTRMGDRFLGFMAKHEESVIGQDTAEQRRLADALQSATDSNDRLLLEQTIKANEENRLEAQNAFGEMRNFVTTLKQAMGAVGSAARCQDLTCGAHAYCAMDNTMGASCLCKDGYQGNGFICKSPARFAIHSLLQLDPAQQRPQVADIHVGTLKGDTIVVVYRDLAKGHKGYALLGHAAPDSLRWHSPVLFSNQSKAFSPKVTHLMQAGGEAGRIAIAFRNEDRGGEGLLVGGRVDPFSGEILLGAPKAFAKHQAQGMALLPLPDSRVAVVFAEHLPTEQGGQTTAGAMHGSTVLAQVHPDGSAPEIITKARFASGPVARISATQLSPTFFAIAYRQGQGISADGGLKQAEAACIAGHLSGNHFAFNSAPLLLEPEQTNIWSRSLSRIGDNLLAYTYHSGNEEVTKQAVIRADPRTHHLQLLHGPEVVERGFAPVVGSAAIAPTADDVPHETGPFPLSLAERQRQQSARLLTYIGHDGAKLARAQICSVSADGIPVGCKEIGWAGRNVASISGTQVSDGRYVLVYTDARGNPYYQFVGMMDPLI